MIASTPIAGRGTPDGGQALRQHADAVRIVRAVRQHERAIGEHLEAARDGGACERQPDGVLVQAAEQQAHGRDRQRGVLTWYRAGVGTRRPAQRSAALRREAHGEVVGRAGDGEVTRPGGVAQEVWRRADGGAGPACLVLEPIERAEHGVAALDDRGLLGEDQLPRVAEDHGVLKSDVGEHHDGRLDHVGGVQAPAQSGLERDRLHPALRERQQRGDGEHFELRRLAEFGGKTRDLGAHPHHGGREDLLGHGASVDDDTLGPAGDVRREVRPRAHAVSAQQRLAVARRRRLAVGAHDVHDPVRVLRPAEAREQLAHALQPRPHAERGQRLEVGLPAERVRRRVHRRLRARRSRAVAHASRSCASLAARPSRSATWPASFSRSLATTASGARPTNFSLPSLASPRSTSAEPWRAAARGERSPPPCRRRPRPRAVRRARSPRSRPPPDRP